jgi:sporulation protein YlmC with PRC-barrel domain
MSKWPRLAMSSVIALALTAPAVADNTPPTPVPAPDAPRQSTQTAPAPSPTAAQPEAAVRSDGIASMQQNGQILASNLIGMKVIGPDEAAIGEIGDLVVDEQNQVVSAVLSVGGLLGLGAKDVGVQWSSLEVRIVDGTPVAMTNLTKEELADLPKYKTLADLEAERQRKATAPATSGGVSAPTAPTQ